MLTALQQLNSHKSPGPDDLHPLVLKELASAIAAPLTRLFNMSLEQGKLSSQWKLAHISPRYKGGPRQLAGSYRPISLTCIACKVMERLIARRLQSYLEEHGLLTTSQHVSVSVCSTMNHADHCRGIGCCLSATLCGKIKKVNTEHKEGHTRVQ